MGNRNPGLD